MNEIRCIYAALKRICGIFASVTVLRGTHWAAGCPDVCKNENFKNHPSSSFSSAASKSISVWGIFWLLHPWGNLQH